MKRDGLVLVASLIPLSCFDLGCFRNMVPIPETDLKGQMQDWSNIISFLAGISSLPSWHLKGQSSHLAIASLICLPQCWALNLYLF